MRFGYTILYVDDVGASLGFYERAFGLERRFLHESGQYAELETGDTTLAFATHELAASNLPQVYEGGGAGHPPAQGGGAGHPPAQGGGAGHPPARPAFEVCFVTNDVAGGFERAVRAGAAAVTSPHTKPWGQDVAYVRDPDGNLVEIASPAG